MESKEYTVDLRGHKFLVWWCVNLAPHAPLLLGLDTWSFVDALVDRESTAKLTDIHYLCSLFNRTDTLLLIFDLTY